MKKLLLTASIVTASMLSFSASASQAQGKTGIINLSKEEQSCFREVVDNRWEDTGNYLVRTVVTPKRIDHQEAKEKADRKHLKQPPHDIYEVYVDGDIIFSGHSFENAKGAILDASFSFQEKREVDNIRLTETKNKAGEVISHKREYMTTIFDKKQTHDIFACLKDIKERKK